MVKLIVLFIPLVSLLACASGTALKSAQLTTAGVQIVTSGGQGVIRPFESFTPIGVAPSACYTDSAYSTITPILFNGPASAQLNTGIRAGAVAVQIRFADGRPTLFGRLLFCPIDTTAAAYGIAEYEIEIPDRFVETAHSGELTSVFAKTPLTSGFKEYTWILWLSKDPI
jgi:hypothetical protein